MRHDARRPTALHRRPRRLALLLACAALMVPAAAAPDAGAAKRRSAPTTATVPDCSGLTWTWCSSKLTKLGFTNFERALDPYDNCGCGAAGVWRIIDDYGNRIEGATIPKTSHFLVQTNPD